MRSMGLSQIKCSLILVIFISIFTALSASNSISDGVFESSVIGERRLLQAKKPCPVNFEFQNYTVITSKCKGPDYAVNACCSAFKEFACPFSDYINDLTNECASIMFNYINLSGRYPAGLFASECREGKEGLLCPELSPSASQNETLSDKNSGGGVIIREVLPLLMLVAASAGSLLRFI